MRVGDGERARLREGVRPGSDRSVRVEDRSGSGPVRSEPGSPLLGPSRTPNRTFGSVQALSRTLNRTSVRFGKVQVRTEVQNRTPASLLRWSTTIAGVVAFYLSYCTGMYLYHQDEKASIMILIFFLYAVCVLSIPEENSGMPYGVVAH